MSKSAEQSSVNTWHQHTERERERETYSRATESGGERDWEMKCETKRGSNNKLAELSGGEEEELEQGAKDN